MRAFYVSLFLALGTQLILATTVHAAEKERKPNNVPEVKIRCSGKKANRVMIGFDFSFDQTDVITSAASYEREAVAVMDPSSLVSANRFIMFNDKTRKLQMFGFRTLNDGLTAHMMVYYVAGEANRSSNRLQLTYLDKDKAVSEIKCVVLN